MSIKQQIRNAIASGFNPTIEHQGDTWRIVGCGVERNGAIYLHLASTTRFQSQKNGNNPIQTLDWVSEETAAQSLSLAQH